MIRRLLRLLDIAGTLLSSGYLRYTHFRRPRSSYLYERPIEYSFTLETLLKHEAIEVLDVGTGTNSFASTLEHCGFNITAIDQKGTYWGLFQNRHLFVHRDDIRESRFSNASYDAVTCISTLEHIDDFDRAVDAMVRLLKDEGILILTFPYTHDVFCENVYSIETVDHHSKEFGFIARSYSDDQINGWCARHSLKILNCRYIRGWTGKFWRSGDRIRFPRTVDCKKDANAICLALRKMGKAIAGVS